jgi:SNF2 family DNA or RNA helicase
MATKEDMIITETRPEIILHAFWDKEEDSLVIWGEDFTKTEDKPKRKRKKNSPHPFAATPATLIISLDKLFPGTMASVTTGSSSIILPGDKSGTPIPSSEEVPEDYKNSGFIVPTLSVRSKDLFFLLESVNQDSEVSAGDSLEYWRLCLSYTVFITSAGLIVPKVHYDYPDTLRTGWMPVKFGYTMKNYYSLLESSAPKVALPGGEEPEEVFESFISSVIKAVVGQSLGPKSGSNRKEKRFSHRTPVDQQFIEYLKGERDQFTSEEYKLGNFARVMKPHLEQAESKAMEYEDELRQSLEDVFIPLIRVSNNPDNIYSDWLLTFGFQSESDPSQIYTTYDFWSDPAISEYSKAGYLKAINEGSEIYPPLKESAGDMYREPVILPADDAFDLLLNYSDKLEESGFVIETPSWWKKPAKKAGLKVSVESDDENDFSASSIADFSWEVAVGSTKLNAEEFEDLVMQKIPVIKYRGNWIRLNADEIKSQIERLKKKFPDGKVSTTEMLRLDAEEDTEVCAKGRAGEMLAAIREPGKMPQVSLPETFTGTLRPYQERGLCWLSYMLGYGFGICLADDMGLGKTIQLISYLASDPDGTEKTLIVAPMSVLGNWKREINRFLPGADVYIHHGAARSKGEDFVSVIKEHRIILTTYQLIPRDAEVFENTEWDLIVLDEAQNIKNHRTKQSRTVRKLNGRKKVALTGTPVENRLQELWSIMDFLNPGFLGSYTDFKAIYGDSKLNENSGEVLRRLIRPFMLRRLKTDKTIIEDLPDKMEMKVFCPLSEEQAALYSASVAEMLEDIEESSGIERKGRVLRALTRLKQICNHPALFLKEGKLKEGQSGKLDRLVEMLEEVTENDEKALIFTQYATFADLLKDYLIAETKVPVYLIHGGVSRGQREIMINRFQKSAGPAIFILSLKAGGTGLNLTAASHVFHIDRWWNPAVESQATDRAYRIGQDKNVQVRMMISSGTLEEKIDAMIERKKDLADKVLTAGDKWLTDLSNDEIRDIITLRVEEDELL